MTLPPHKIGDVGQRFEIRVRSTIDPTDVEDVGYSDDPFSFHDAIRITPKWKRTLYVVEVVDRDPESDDYAPVLRGLTRRDQIKKALLRAGVVLARLENVLRKESNR